MQEGLSEAGTKVGAGSRVGTRSSAGTDLRGEADFGFTAGVGDAHSAGFVGRKLVAGEDSGTVTA